MFLVGQREITNLRLSNANTLQHCVQIAIYSLLSYKTSPKFALNDTLLTVWYSPFAVFAFVTITFT